MPAPSRMFMSGGYGGRRTVDAAISEAARSRSAEAHHDTYRGWKISHNPARPITGQWRAERHGVGLCAGDRDALLRMIDAKIAQP